MIKCNLRTVRNAVRAKEEFKCNNSLSGEWTHHVGFGWINESVSLANHLNGATKNFAVYSYDTPIAVYNHKGWWINEDKYTVTTSRHMSAIRAGIS